MLVVQAAGKRLGDFRLDQHQPLEKAYGGREEIEKPLTTLYVTLEPCHMCLGAAMLARVDRLVFAATSRKYGAVLSNSDRQKYVPEHVLKVYSKHIFFLRVNPFLPS